MPAFTYLSNAQVDRYSIVLGDENATTFCNSFAARPARIGSSELT